MGCGQGKTSLEQRLTRGGAQQQHATLDYLCLLTTAPRFQAWNDAGAAVTFGIHSERFRPALEKLTAEWRRRPAIVVADAADDASLDAAFRAIADAHDGKLSAVLHAIAHAPASALKAPMVQCSRQDFAATHDVSAYSLIALAKRSLPLLEAGGGGSITALSYIGSTRSAAGYGVMGPAKASLEAVARGLAAELVSREEVA